MKGGRELVVSEINRFALPGVDLRQVTCTDSYVYGMLPPDLFRQVGEGFVGWVRARSLRTTPRVQGGAKQRLPTCALRWVMLESGLPSVG